MKPMRVLALVEAGQRDLALPIRHILEAEGSSTFAFIEAIQPEQFVESEGTAGLEAIRHAEPDLMLVCSGHGGMRRIHAAVRAARLISPELPVVAFANGSDPQHVCDILSLGVQDFVTAPVKAVDLLPRLLRFKPAAERHDSLSPGLKERMGLKDFVGESPALLNALRSIPAVARCDASVLITGETGTGKELCARAIHYLSARSGRAFMPVNCGAIPLDLVENQLFGHERGAYTGADSASPGLLRSADGGTILLDEVDSLPLSAQVKLLRFLQEKQFQPLGSSRTCTVDLRILAACNANLVEAVRAGRFRQDLYFRLNVVPIHLPPLRDRREDIPVLARHFLHRYGEKFAKRVRGFSGAAMQKLFAYDWPGNVRELESVVERAVVLAERATLQGEDMLFFSPGVDAGVGSFKALKAQAIEQFERAYIQQLLCVHEGNITKASQAARKDRRAFWELMRKHRLLVPTAAPLA